MIVWKPLCNLRALESFQWGTFEEVDTIDTQKSIDIDG